jgi:hypothetical protein
VRFLDILLPTLAHDCMIVRFTSTYDSCHGHDCMIVRFTSTYDSCHGHDCMIVRFTEVNLAIIQSCPLQQP